MIINQTARKRKNVVRKITEKIRDSQYRTTWIKWYMDKHDGGLEKAEKAYENCNKSTYGAYR